MSWMEENLPKLTINNMTLGQVSKAVKMESLLIKLTKVLAALTTGIISGACCYYFLEMHKRQTGI